MGDLILGSTITLASSINGSIRDVDAEEGHFLFWALIGQPPISPGTEEPSRRKQTRQYKAIESDPDLSFLQLLQASLLPKLRTPPLSPSQPFPFFHVTTTAGGIPQELISSSLLLGLEPFKGAWTPSLLPYVPLT